MKPLILLFLAISLTNNAFGQLPALVPVPRELSLQPSVSLQLPASILTAVHNDVLWKRHLGITGELIERMTRGKYRIDTSGDFGAATLVVRQDRSLGSEGYSLQITDQQILINASGMKGLSHATATLLQIVGGADRGSLPGLSLVDKPKSMYRNFMIDMGRNPHSIQLLKETIDLLWFYKIDSLQLHLTDDQRFAFPSNAFPKLWDGKITLAEFRELESYAVDRGVTIIPELEVPGHTGKLRGLYPEVFGATGTDLVNSEVALEGVKTLLDEMMDVFSSTPYIHIGGDEAFGVPEELQRDLINKLHAYLKTKGRQTLVWEGPRPGRDDNRVNTEVIHLNWRTINYPADQMLEDGYRVVNAAWDPLYLVDHYPRTNFTMTSPQHIYETLALTTFKHVNPQIQTYHRPLQVQESEQLIGFCMPWWEGREKNFFPQVVPRMIPFADVAWHPLQSRDYAEFAGRASATEAARQAAYYPVDVNASGLVVPEDGVFHHEAMVELQSNEPLEIRYTLDGSPPSLSSTLYQKPIAIEATMTVRAAAFSGGQQTGHGSRRNFTLVQPIKNLALGKPVQSTVSSGSPFSTGRITDGGTENLEFFLAYPADPEPVLLTIDLGSSQTIRSVTVVAYTVSGSYEKYTVEISEDGDHFVQVASRLEKPAEVKPSVEHRFSARKARFVRIVSHGNKGYVFDSFSKVVEVLVQ